MGQDSFRIAATDVVEDRFSRFRLLQWWDQERIRNANVAVVGAGALGNEILKNLALLGFERVVVVDSDRIELSNLSRSVLYRVDDVGRTKAETAAAAFRCLYDRASVVGLPGNILFDVGVGLFDWADVIIAGLDNREARLWINRCAWNMGRPWIDGAIEGLSGVARVFLPGQPPCYECTLGEADWRLLDRRMSCNLLTRHEMDTGRVPTTPTTAAVIAGIQVQEALKYIHRLPVLQSKAYVFDGIHHTSYVVEYTENPECFGHHVHERVVRVQETSSDLTLNDLYTAAQAELHTDNAVLEFSREIIHKLVCPTCGREEELFAPVGTVGLHRARCAGDGATRAVIAVHNYTGSESYGCRKLNDLGLPLWDVYVARAGESEIAFLISGDAASVVGPLSIHDEAAL
ncbi:MAG: ThiF family adenylyltransferase [Acidobacteria bacterium]|nr:ThiF family adenylyltransferase [Acidobacteriota bacterium]